MSMGMINGTTYTGKGITCAIESIGPEQAAAYLEHNISNRNIQEPRVNAYASDIMSGRWVCNGEAIKFDSAGNLVDGQHRLTAIVKAGIPMQTLVVRGVGRDTVATMDTGKSRSLSDVLKMRGEPNNSALATVLAAVVRMRKADVWVAAANAGSTHTPATNTECLSLLDAERVAMGELTRFSMRERESTGLSVKVSAIAAHALRQVDEEFADMFLSELRGQVTDRESPIYQLRWKVSPLNRDHVDARFARIQLAMLIKAWNLWVEDRPCKVLRFNAKEALPIPVDPSTMAPTNHPYFNRRGGA